MQLFVFSFKIIALGSIPKGFLELIMSVIEVSSIFRIFLMMLTAELNRIKVSLPFSNKGLNKIDDSP